MRNTKSLRQRLQPDDHSSAAGAVQGRKQKKMPPTEDNSVNVPGSCRVCGSGDVWTFVEICGVPVHSNVLLPSRSEALLAPKGDLDMKCCRDCGHVYNAAFSAEKTQYSSDYENSLFCSETFRTYAESLAAELIERFDLREKKVVEIGCGSGDFLKLICEKGGNVGTGYDPSSLAGRSIESHTRVRFVRDYYFAGSANVDADLLCSRHVLEHIERPRNFLKEIRESLPAEKNTNLFIEVPDVMFMLQGHSSWDFIYEHCSYFSLSSLRRLFSLCGFKTRDMWRTFHNQFLCACVEATRIDTDAHRTVSDTDKEDVVRNAEMFGQVFQKQVKAWERRLRLSEKSKAKVVLWGAGSKAVTFLNILRGVGSPEYVVDVNKLKHGKYIPGTAQRIVSPDFLKEYKPDMVILMNPAYETEVGRNISDMELNPNILLANHPEVR